MKTASAVLVSVLVSLLSTPALADLNAFIAGLRDNGATNEELQRFEAQYREAPDALRQRFDNSSVTDLKGFLDYQRAAWANQDAHPLLKIGAPLPAFELRGVDNKVYTPADFADAKLLVVAFITNHCPASQMYEKRFMQLVEDFAKQGVAFVAIQPDAPEAAAPSEHNYTDVEDDFAGMIERARYRDFNFPYLDDGAEQRAAAAFGPKVTPHLFIFDQQRVLRYEGRIDDHLRPEKATTHEARDAIEALLADRAVETAHTPVFGCSVKWRDQMQGAEREKQQWQAMPVELQTVSLDGLRELRTAPPGDQLTIINMWATWCGPCRVEMPELIKSYQWYRSRGVELVTVSLDEPGSRDQVMGFLNGVHSPGLNLLVDTDDVYAVQAAFDTQWQSGVPYTLVLDRFGQVIFRHEGEVDIMAMRRRILAHLDEPGIFEGNAAYWRE